jgi:hypothetical protein
MVEVAVDSTVGVIVAAADVGVHTVDRTTTVFSCKTSGVAVMLTAGRSVGVVESCMLDISHAARSKAKSVIQLSKENFMSTGSM